jgi:hypothetical protein
VPKVHVQQHLPKVAMGEFANLQIDHDVALEFDMVKHQVWIEAIAVERQTQLPAHEGKATAQFKQERLHLPDQGFLDARLYQSVRLRKLEKLKNIRGP